MGAPAIVMNDRIVGTCPNHLYPAPSGTTSAGPQPFSAPLTLGLATRVLIGSKAAAVMGSSGFNAPPHVGIVDPPFAAANMQVGRVLSGSTSVLIESKPAATSQSQAQCCATPGKVAPSVMTVQIG